MRVTEIRYTGPDPIETGNFEDISGTDEHYQAAFYVNDCGTLEVFLDKEARAFRVRLDEDEAKALVDLIKTMYLS